MAEVSDARQAIRNYAREAVRADVPVSGQQTVEVVAGVRGETAGKTFEALQEILTLCEDIRSTKKVLSPLGVCNTIEWIIEQAMTR